MGRLKTQNNQYNIAGENKVGDRYLTLRLPRKLK